MIPIITSIKIVVTFQDRDATVRITIKMIRWLKLPQMKNILNVYTPAANLAYAKVIQAKPYLKKIYTDFYNRFKKSICGDTANKLLVELGSGAGFIKEIIPNVVTSDIVKIPNTDRHFSALDMPFEDNTVDAYFMINVMHHVNDVRAFFGEVNRCLKVGGKVVMIEPANTSWSRFVYRNFHHERFDPWAGWKSETDDPLFSANSAVPWIVFYRDRQKFEREFPALEIINLVPHTPLRYLISGGFFVRQLLPSCTYEAVQGIERLLTPFNKHLGMFLTIEIEKYR